MEANTTQRVTISVNLAQEYEFDISDEDVPDGQTIEDVALNRAVEKACDEVREWPGAFITTDDIEDVDDE
jgi:hypothetical protein